MKNLQSFPPDTGKSSVRLNVSLVWESEDWQLLLWRHPGFVGSQAGVGLSGSIGYVGVDFEQAPVGVSILGDVDLKSEFPLERIGVTQGEGAVEAGVVVVPDMGKRNLLLLCALLRAPSFTQSLQAKPKITSSILKKY